MVPNDIKRRRRRVTTTIIEINYQNVTENIIKMRKKASEWKCWKITEIVALKYHHVAWHVFSQLLLPLPLQHQPFQIQYDETRIEKRIFIYSPDYTYYYRYRRYWNSEKNKKLLHTSRRSLSVADEWPGVKFSIFPGWFLYGEFVDLIGFGSVP